MNVITTTDQTIYFAPRLAPGSGDYTADMTTITADSTLITADAGSGGYTYTLTDESTKEAITNSINATLSGNYYTADLNFSPVEGRYYYLEIKQGDAVAYRGKLFCTNQSDLEKYTINANTYTTVGNNVSYTIIND